MPRSTMKIPNGRNAQLMGTKRIAPFRRGGVPGPFIVTPPVIAVNGGGPVAPGAQIDLVQAPVWDGTETSSGWEWLVGGASVQAGGNSYTLQPGEELENIAVRAFSANALGGSSSAVSNPLTLLAPTIIIPTEILLAGASTFDMADYAVGHVDTYEATGPGVVSVTGSVVEMTAVAGDYTVLCTVSNGRGADDDTALVRVVALNLYVNPELAGGAASGPGAGGANNPPTAHSIVFNTIDSGPVASGAPGVFHWDINPAGAAGRSFLTYRLEVNNPGLQIGDRITCSWKIRDLSAVPTSTPVITVNGAADVNLTYGNRNSVAGQLATVQVTVEILGAAYEAEIRVGVGTTTTRSEHFRIEDPIAFLEPTPFLIGGTFDLTVGQDGNRTGYARNTYGAMNPDTAGGFNIGRFIARDSGQIIFRLRNFDDSYTGDVLIEYDSGQTELLAYQGGGEWSGFNQNLEAYLQANVGSVVQIVIAQP